MCGSVAIPLHPYNASDTQSVVNGFESRTDHYFIL